MVAMLETAADDLLCPLSRIKTKEEDLDLLLPGLADPGPGSKEDPVPKEILRQLQVVAAVAVSGEIQLRGDRARGWGSVLRRAGVRELDEHRE